jgi:hypothetical protein
MPFVGSSAMLFQGATGALQGQHLASLDTRIYAPLTSDLLADKPEIIRAVLDPSPV